MIGLMISCLVANSDQANSIIPVILIFQILFSGVIFKLTGFGEVFGGFFAMRWSMIGMGSSVGLTAFPMGYDPNDSSFPYAHDTGHVLGAWFALLVMIAIFGALTTYFLKRKDRLGR
jgi:ABC transport system ATP-binding/permease protein